MAMRNVIEWIQDWTQQGRHEVGQAVGLDEGTSHSVWKGAVAGGIAGLAGTLAMTGFQSLWSAAQSIARRGERENESAGGDEEQQSVPTTGKAASKVKRLLTGRPIEDETALQASGQAVHFGYGTLLGALYGAVRELAPRAGTGLGLPFGMAAFVVGDEVAVPATGLSPAPWKQPLGTHAYAAISHAVYGATTDLVLRTTRRLLDRKG